MPPVQRKVFRIEESASTRLALRDVATERANGSENSTEYASLRAIIEPRGRLDQPARERALAQIAEAQSFKRELELIHAVVVSSRANITALGMDIPARERIGRAGRELAAIVAATEHATRSILQAAEEIDQAACTLAAAMKSSHDKGLTGDIQERVVQIFEACNFQDLTGQRVAQVLATLNFLEEHTTRLLEIWRGVEPLPAALVEQGDDDRHLLNGPKLADDDGHSSQLDIDAMFAEVSRAS